MSTKAASKHRTRTCRRRLARRVMKKHDAVFSPGTRLLGAIKD